MESNIKMDNNDNVENIFLCQNKFNGKDVQMVELILNKKNYNERPASIFILERLDLINKIRIKKKE